MHRVSRAIAGAMLFCLTPSAWGLTMTQTQGLSGTPNYTMPVEFNQFNPSLGTLNSVSIRMDLAISGGSLTVDNDGPQPATIEVDLGAKAAIYSTDVLLFDSGGNLILSGINQLGVATGSTFNLAADDGDGATFDAGAPDADQHVGGDASTFSESQVNPLFHSGYIGTGTFEITVDVNQILDFGGKGGISGQFDPVMADTTVWVTYNYEPVPEPSTLGLAGLSLLAGYNSFRKRRRISL